MSLVLEKQSARHFVLGGKVMLHQNADGGHRAGLDAVMLAASVKAPSKNEASYHVVDLGAGVGTAGLCVVARLTKTTVTLVENDPSTLTLAERTLLDPANADFSNRATLLSADVTLRGDERIAAGLKPDMADHVIMNPPYWDGKSVRRSPSMAKATAHVLGAEGLTPWFRTATSILRSNSKMSVIFPADGLDHILVEMRGRFGGVTIFPLFKSAEEPAIRVIVTGIKGSRAPARILPGLVLHEPKEEGVDRRPWTAKASAVLNGEASLVI